MITGHGARVIKLYDPVITVLSIAVLSITVLSIADQLDPPSSQEVPYITFFTLINPVGNIHICKNTLHSDQAHFSIVAKRGGQAGGSL